MTDTHPFFAQAARHDTWAIADKFRVIMDCIPTMVAAETIAGEMNMAWHRGYEAARADMRAALGIAPS